ncbi:methylated-DNA--[protein]-cysteine S-methyltransferase [Lacticaseibacillus jixianensis]|uniref:Methylated-DNA--[protein]-cysteine S-methyltransferase n=1 Tax=Lacticaseibacillus jixianensis TaxID=2486012 RepID=A0ABW4BBT9_9LACO|nr:methylated-DNA--[protein]-cysteine S-methyltransferase [Lacticaseibacillus jixianensis]
MLAQSTYESPLGEMTLLADDDHLLGVWFQDQQYFGGTVDLRLVPRQETRVLITAGRWLEAFFAGAQPEPRLVPVQLSGTAYRQAVLCALLEVPYGAVTTYGELAAVVSRRLGRRAAPRAIGGAVAHNPLSVIVPCHRVIGQAGALVGYAGGIDRKMMLLGMEGHTVDVDRQCLVADQPAAG